MKTTSTQLRVCKCNMEVSRPRRRLQRRTTIFSLILTSVFFFFFQPKATRAGDEKHRKKAHGLIWFLFSIFAQYLLFFHPGCSGMCCFTRAALLGPLRGRNSCCCGFGSWSLVFHCGMARQISPLPPMHSSSTYPLSNRSVLHDGRKHKTVVFSQPNALRK